uniref:Uncharacterized protein n=1 Tax=Nelumbo nucifera TaxID=4432 RepID=A0A822ZPL3_NELNU|nr:TPA_asm: hypothetical protein HUJ06_016357 [Nelumbo nucifera]
MNFASRSFFTSLLHFTEQKNLHNGRTLHAQIVKSGLGSDLFLANSLVNYYAKCGHLVQAQLQFEEIDNKDVISWNCLINGYSQQSSPEGSSLVVQLFQRMRTENVIPNAHTLAGVLTTAANLSDASFGQQAHCVSIKIANSRDIFVGCSLINMYCKSGFVLEGRRVFDRMPERNSVSWTTMISGYAVERLTAEAMLLFKLMRCEEGDENEFVFTSILSALVLPEHIDNVKQVHCVALRNGLVSFLSVRNALVTSYTKSGNSNDALGMFESSTDRNTITWSAMITGYAQTGNSEDALCLFSKMQSFGIRPSKFTFVGVLNACSDIGAVREGKQVHDYLLKLGFESQVFIRTALVDMYAKCGCVVDARKGFDQLQDLILCCGRQ